MMYRSSFPDFPENPAQYIHAIHMATLLPLKKSTLEPNPKIKEERKIPNSKTKWQSGQSVGIVVVHIGKK
jgi:hypothetical protein